VPDDGSNEPKHLEHWGVVLDCILRLYFNINFATFWGAHAHTNTY